MKSTKRRATTTLKPCKPKLNQLNPSRRVAHLAQQLLEAYGHQQVEVAGGIRKAEGLAAVHLRARIQLPEGRYSQPGRRREARELVVGLKRDTGI